MATENTNPEINKEKAKKIYTHGLVSLEVLELAKMPANEEQAEEIYQSIVKHKTYIVDDLSKPYLIRIAYTENKSALKSVDPEYLDEGDQYEISETIQDILRENDFPVIKSDFPNKDQSNQKDQPPIIPISEIKNGK